MTTFSRRGFRALAVLLPLAFSACGGSSDPNETADESEGESETSGSTATQSECERCLASGGTWQPGSGCTQGCAVQDTSCYEDRCPDPCDANNCGDCQGATACEAAGCQWNQEAEAGWCTGGAAAR